LTPVEISLLIAVGAVAGVLNTLAGGGSLLTVPLLVLFGLPGTVANGTNRVGILLQSLVAVWRFKAEGISELRNTLPLLLPIGLGSALGAMLVTRIPDAAFEQLFAGIMLLLAIPMLRGYRTPSEVVARRWSPRTTAVVFFAVGVYGGAIQAGVGIFLIFALTRAGLDLVRASAAKMIVVAGLALVAVPVFVLEDRVAWLPAAFVSIGFALGAAAGARIAVRRGERVIRPVLGAAVLALAGHMLGLY
jgi:uncharacterized membrane protein YfcA